MKKAFYITILIFSALQAKAQWNGTAADIFTDDTPEVASMRSTVQYLSSAFLEGRKAGGEGEAQAAQYIYKCMEATGLDMLCPAEGDIFGIRQDGGDTLRSHNVLGFVQGYDPDFRDHYIVVGARYDNLGTNEMTVDGIKTTQVYTGAVGNNSGVAMMIELARKVVQNKVGFARSVVFVAFGAGCEGMAGSWYFLNRTFAKDADKIDMMINLDALGCKGEGFYAYTSANDDLDRMVNTLNTEVFPLRPQLSLQEIYPSDHRSFYASEIPSLTFTSGRYAEYATPRDTPAIVNYDKMERELEYIYDFTLRAATATTPAPSFRRMETIAREDISSTDDVVSYFDTGVRPLFLGSSDPQKFLKEWVYKYLRYPQECVNKGIQGKVMVSMVIEKDGKVSNVKVVKGVHPALDEEAVRVVSSSPSWRAGRLNGQKVRTALNVVVEFRLERRK